MSPKIICDCALKEERFFLPKSDVLCTLLHMTKPRAQFFSYIISEFLTSNSKMNFKQLASKSDKTEQYFHRNFSYPFDFAKFNMLLANEYLSKKLVLAMTTINVPKSGIKTYGSDLFRNGNSGGAKNGLTFTTLSVVELENGTAMHLEALQLPNRAYLNKWGLSHRDLSLSLIGQVIKKKSWSGSYLNVDSHHFHRDFSCEIHKMGLYLIGSLDNYSDFLYPSIPTTSGKKGRPRKYAGRVDFLDMSPNYFEMIHETDEYQVHHGVVYNKKLFRKVSIIVCRKRDSNEQPLKIFYSTDTEAAPTMLLKYYNIPELIESLHDDARIHTGLYDCQGRNKGIIRYHVNASLTAVNVARAERWLSRSPESRGLFSMYDSKLFYQKKLNVEKKTRISLKCEHRNPKSDRPLRHFEDPSHGSLQHLSKPNLTCSSLCEKNP